MGPQAVGGDHREHPAPQGVLLHHPIQPLLDRLGARDPATRLARRHQGLFLAVHHALELRAQLLRGNRPKVRTPQQRHHLPFLPEALAVRGHRQQRLSGVLQVGFEALAGVQGKAPHVLQRGGASPWQQAEVALAFERAHQVHVHPLPALEGHHRLADFGPGGGGGRDALCRSFRPGDGLQGLALLGGGQQPLAQGLHRPRIRRRAAGQRTLARAAIGKDLVDGHPTAAAVLAQAEGGSKGPQDPVGALQGGSGGRHRIRTGSRGFRLRLAKLTYVINR